MVDHKDVQQLLDEAQVKVTAANDLLKKEERSASDTDEFEKLMGEAKELTDRAVQTKTILVQDTQIQDNKEKAEALRKQNLAPKNKPNDFKSLGEMLMAVFRSTKHHEHDERLIPWEPETGSTKALTDAEGSSGGFLVRQQFRNELQSVAAENSIVRPRATIFRMNTRVLPIPVLDQTTVPVEGTSAFFGGIVVRWLESDAAKEETQPKFRQVSLVSKELSAYTEVSNTLMADSAQPLQDFLQSPLGFSGAIAHAEDYAFFRGSGVGEPLGVLNSPAVVKIPRAAALKVDYPDLVKMVSRSLMGGQYLWSFHQTALPELFQLEDAAGNNIWLPHVAGVANGGFGNLLGSGVTFTEKLQVLGTEGDALYADWRYYVIGDRQAVTVDTSEHYLFQKNQTAWRVITRLDGMPWLSKPIPLADGTTTVSPFVTLTDAP